MTFVYLHKIECMRQQARPDPWPPELPERDPLEAFTEAYEAMRTEFLTRGPAAPSYTWYAPDQTVGFWFRRMAQETAIHRVDVELAADQVTPIDAELAADGVDEALRVMLAGDWSDEPLSKPLAGKTVELAANERSWLVAFEETSIAVLPGGRTPDAQVSGDPSDLVRWIWGRGPLEPLTVQGDEEVVPAFRDQVKLATG